MKDNYGNRYRFYEIMQAHKNGEDLSQFTPKNKPEEDLIAKLKGGNGGAEYIEDVTKSPVEVGSSGDVYFNMNGATPEEIATCFNDIVSRYESELKNNSRFQMASLFMMSDNSSVIIEYNWDFSRFSIKSMDLNTLQFLELYHTAYGFLHSEDTYSMPIRSDVVIEENTYSGDITLVPVDCPELVNKLFYIGKKESKLVANADITSEQLNGLDTVEVVTPTETKVFGGSGGSAVSPFQLNNPESKVYYGQYISGKTLVIDLPKLGQYLAKAFGDDIDTLVPAASSGGSGSVKSYHIDLIGYDTFGTHFENNHSYPYEPLRLYFDNGTLICEDYWYSNITLGTYDSGDTVEAIFNKIGTVRISEHSCLRTEKNGIPVAYFVSNIMLLLTNSDMTNTPYLEGVDLNEFPIDFMWFE